MSITREILETSDAQIADAVQYASPLILRGLLYQLTGDESLRDIPVGAVPAA